MMTPCLALTIQSSVLSAFWGQSTNYLVYDTSSAQHSADRDSKCTCWVTYLEVCLEEYWDGEVEETLSVFK